MDSTLLDQIRHLCRDRSAYEHLKAILVQQERVLQLSWEERYEKLVSDQVADTQASNIFSNILAREKALAQLADAIQRSPSLELVLQVAVQAAQKVLQVDRVAIFRRHLDGRGEFATDAIASGIISIADMPERQLLLARYMIESMQTEQSTQTVDSIGSLNLSSHIITLLEQIGISSYAANKIYIGHDVWGVLVAFHGSAYHSWSESDRTSLSLVASQIGIAISLSNLRQQSQDLTEELNSLQIELDDLQQTVTDIINHEPKAATIYPNNVIDESIVTIFSLDDISDSNHDLDDDDQSEDISSVNLVGQEQEQQALEPKELQQEKSEQTLVNELDESKESNENLDKNLDNTSEFDKSEEIQQNLDKDLDSTGEFEEDIEEIEEEIKEIDEEIDQEIVDSDYAPISQNGLPRLFLLQGNTKLDDIDHEGFNVEDSGTIESIESVEIESDHLPVVESGEPEITVLKTSELKDFGVAIESPTSLETSPDLPSSNSNQEEIALEVLEISNNDLVTENVALEPIDLELPIETSNDYLDSSILEVSELEIDDSQVVEQTLIASEVASDLDLPDSAISESQVLCQESSIVSEVLSQEAIALDPVLEDSDRDPAIEPQFIETILSIAGNDQKGVSFLLDVIDAYLEDTPHLVQEIDKAIAINDHSRLLQLLNTLRTSSEYIGALPLSSQCRQLESAVRANYVAIYACLSQVAIESQRATDALRIARSRYVE